MQGLTNRSTWYSPGTRFVLQGALSCSGWSGEIHDAVASGTCYPRSQFWTLVNLAHDIRSSAAGVMFSLMPLHLANIFAGHL